METKDIAKNKKALRDYAILETVEAGIELVGSEVKSLRESKASLQDSFARIEGNEIFVHNIDIAPYAQASYLNVEPKSLRRLLLHRHEIVKLQEKTSQRGFTLVPLKLYFNERGRVKLLLALAKGKKLYDKREDIKRRESNLELRRIMKSKRR